MGFLYLCLQVACLIRVPTEVVKQRTQASPTSTTYRILLATVTEEVRQRTGVHFSNTKATNATRKMTFLKTCREAVCFGETTASSTSSW